MESNTVNYSSASIDKTVIVKDNVERIKESIDNRGKVYNIFLIKPQPTTDFRLKYKEGTTNREHMSFFESLFKKKRYYNWNIYEYTWRDGHTELFNEQSIKNFIQQKYNHPGSIWIKYIFNEKNKDMPIYEGYSLHVLFCNKYGNPCGCSTIYNLITEDEKEATKIYQEIKEKYNL